MKIALIMVKGGAYSFPNRPFFLKHMPDSLTLGMLHSIIKNSYPEIEVEIYDETVEIVKKENINADIIGISAITPAINRAIEYADFFHSKNIPVFLGGAHATLAPNSCVEKFDSVLIGLANDTLPELINDFQNNRLKKIYTLSASMSYDNFVFPSRHIYEDKHILGTELNMVQATYGCSNICKFCVQPYICNGYHQRPVQNVLDEISKIESDYIEFVDPNFAKDLNYLKEICTGLKNLKKTWFAPMTMAVINNEENLKMLKDAGCTGVLIGFESINTTSIDTISKGFNNIKQYENVVKMFHKYGIEVTGSFVLGLDGDNKETASNTLNFIKSAQIDYVRFTINTPFPGTEYYEEMKKGGRLLTEDYNLYDCCHCVIKPSNLSAQEVEAVFEKLWKESHSLKNIIARLSYIKSPVERLKIILKNYIFGKVYLNMVVKYDKRNKK